MDTLLNYIKKNWGKTQNCVGCNTTPTSFCGNCIETVYCGKECQLIHWNQSHQFECISAGGKEKRGREEKKSPVVTKKTEKTEEEDDDIFSDYPSEEDDVNILSEKPEVTKKRGEREDKKRSENPDSKKKQKEGDEKEEIALDDLNQDVWERIIAFLNTKDVKNLSVVQKTVQTQIRAAFLRRFRFIITKKELQNPRFREFVPYIDAVKVESIGDLNELLWLKGGNSWVTDVKFINWFDEEVDGRLHSKIKRLTFGWDFNQPVDNLPPSLTHLTLGYAFDRSVNQLPATLTHLTFGSYFNQSVDNLPPALTHLTLGTYFDQPVDRLPTKLTHLTVGYLFRQSLENIPTTVTHLTLSSEYDLTIPAWVKNVTRTPDNFFG
jgi:hypothetical protein